MTQIKLNKTQLKMLRVGALILAGQTRLMKHAEQLVELGLGKIEREENGSSRFSFNVRLEYDDNINEYLAKNKRMA